MMPSAWARRNSVQDGPLRRPSPDRRAWLSQRRGGRKPRFVLRSARYDRLMWSLVYLLIRTLITRMIGTGKRGHDDGVKDLEILVLRHQLRVLLAPPLAVARISWPVDPRDVRRRDLLGGLLHEYHGAAA